MKYDLISRAKRHKLKLQWSHGHVQGYNCKVWYAKVANCVLKVCHHTVMPKPSVNLHADKGGYYDVDLLSQKEGQDIWRNKLDFGRKNVMTLRDKKALAELLLVRMFQGRAIEAENVLNAWNNLTKG
jgi:hypothetical protein